jgi:hypothetical protein
MMTNCFDRLSDQELLETVKELAARERRATADLIASLMELDTRRLYLGEGYSSLFTYCTRALGMSEHAAYGRIEAARAARRCPSIIALLADGSITLTTVTLLGPHLTTENCRDVMASARHKSKREVEEIAARLRPRPPVASVVRKLPAPRPIEGPSPLLACHVPTTTVSSPEPVAPAPARRAVVAALAPELFKIQFTMSREMHDKLRRAQDLLRHVIPNGDVAVVFDRALTALIGELEKRKCGAVIHPRSARHAASESRHIPGSVRRQVWARDGGQCTFTGADGVRCFEHGFLEYHHVVPFAAGGATTMENLRLLCRAHNSHEAEQYFGPLFVTETRAEYSVQTGLSA